MLSKFVIDIFRISENIEPDDLRRSANPINPCTDSFRRSLNVRSGIFILFGFGETDFSIDEFVLFA